jgi:hypothetical protein
MLTYTLTAKGKKAVASKELKPKTHRGAVLLAIRKLGTATAKEICSEVRKQRKIATDMQIENAVSFMLFDLGNAKRGRLEIASKKSAE